MYKLPNTCVNRVLATGFLSAALIGWLAQGISQKGKRSDDVFQLFILF